MPSAPRTAECAPSQPARKAVSQVSVLPSGRRNRTMRRPAVSSKPPQLRPRPDRAAHPNEEAAGRLLEAHELRPALDLDAKLREATGQQPFVLVLRVDQREGIRAQSLSEGSECGVCLAFSAHPEIERPDPYTVLDDFVREADLPIELQRPGLDRERPGGGAALSRTV